MLKNNTKHAVVLAIAALAKKSTHTHTQAQLRHLGESQAGGNGVF